MKPSFIAALGGAPAFIPDTYPGVQPSSFAKWTAALARGAANPARIVFNGDSNLSGEGAGGGALGFNGAALLGIPDQFAMLAGHKHESIFGDQNVTTAATVTAWDTRVTLGTGWTMDTAPSTFGGRFYIAPAGSAGTLTFASGEQWDKAVIWYPKVASANTALEIYVDGVLNTTINQVGANLFGSTTITTTLGVHTIGFKVGATGQGFLTGIVFSDTSSATPITLKGGWCAARMASMNDTGGAWKNRPALLSLAPDFITLYCSINDLRDGMAAATYQTAIDGYVAALSGQANGCLILGYPPNHANWATLAGPYATALSTVATARGWGFWDSRNVFGADNAAADALGYRFDNDHPSLAGHQAFATRYLARLRAWGMSI